MFPSKTHTSTQSREFRELSPAESVAESLASIRLTKQAPNKNEVTGIPKVSLPLEYGPPQTWTQAEKDLNTEIQDLKQRMLKEAWPDMRHYVLAVTAAVDKYYPSGDSQSLERDPRFQSNLYVMRASPNTVSQ